MTAGERIHVVVDSRDNVTTLLDSNVEFARLRGGFAVAPGVPFGHKVALRTIECAEPVVKYGVVIGRATQRIAAGEHVHVHNCA